MKIETRGTLIAGGAVALTAAGLLLVDGVLLALGIAIGLMLGLARVLGAWNLRNLIVTVEGPAVAQAGKRLRMGVNLANDRRLMDAFALRLELHGPGGLQDKEPIPWVAAGSDAAGEIRPFVPDRGYAGTMEARLGSSFPWGVFRFERRQPVNHEMLVFPFPMIPIELLEGAGSRVSGDQRKPGFRDTSGELRGLRDFRAGDAAKSIAWPSSVRSLAQGGVVLVKEMDPPGYQPERVVLLFHSYGTDGALIRPDRFERAISLAWGAARHLHSKRIPIVWLADFEEWVPREVEDPRSLGELGEALARASRSGTTERHEVEARLEEFDREVFLISDMPPESWSILTDLVAGSRVLDVSRYERGLALKGGYHA